MGNRMENAASSKPVVTIGMPVYNGADFIEQALDSLLSQTYNNLKLVISDNSSTDGTKEICQRFAKKDKRIHYVRQEKNIGPAANFNFLLTFAKTEYYMWAAHDDFRDANFIKECIQKLESNQDAIMCFSNLVNVDGNNKIVRTYKVDKIFPSNSPLSYIKLYCRDGKANLIYGIWRSKAIKTSHLYKHWGADMNLVFEQCLKGTFIYTPKVLFYKRLLEKQGLGKSSLFTRRTLKDIQQYFRFLVEAVDSSINSSTGLRLAARFYVAYIKVRYYLTGNL